MGIVGELGRKHARIIRLYHILKERKKANG